MYRIQIRLDITRAKEHKYDSDYLRFFSLNIWVHWREPIKYMDNFERFTLLLFCCLFCISVYFELPDLSLCLFLKWSPFCCFASCPKPANRVDAQDVRSSFSDRRANSNVMLSRLKEIMHTAVYNIKTFDGERAMPYYLFPGNHFVDWDITKIIFLGAAHSHTTYQKPIYFVLKVKLWKGRIFQTIFYALEVKLFNILYSRM